MTAARVLADEDLQAVLRFFATQAAAHLRRFGSLPPACVLVWLRAGAPDVEAVHQFPATEVADLLRTEPGKHKLASAIRAMLDGSDGSEARTPHVVMQVLLTVVPEGEALLLLAHVADATYAIALPKAVDGSVPLPASFDLRAARLDVTG